MDQAPPDHSIRSEMRPASCFVDFNLLEQALSGTTLALASSLQMKATATMFIPKELTESSLAGGSLGNYTSTEGIWCATGIPDSAGPEK